MIENGEGRPTAQSYKVFDELAGRLDAQLARLDQVIRLDLARFNAALLSRKLAPVDPTVPPSAPDTTTDDGR